MITDRIGLHSVLLPLLIIIIITQHLITNLHIRAERKKTITKAAKEIVKTNTKVTRLSLQNKLLLGLSIRKKDIGNNKKKKARKKRNATRLDRGSIRCKRKTCKAIQTRLSRVYGRVAPKESFNSVEMAFRKVHSLGRD